MGVHVRDCRKHTHAKRTGSSPQATSPLCDCRANATYVFGDEAACAVAVATTCRGAPRSSFVALCDACDEGAAGLDATKCRRAVDRAAAVVDNLGLCDATSAPECRAESNTREAPEPYVFWPDGGVKYVRGGLVADDRLGMVPAGSRAANPGDGIGVVGV